MKNYIYKFTDFDSFDQFLADLQPESSAVRSILFQIFSSENDRDLILHLNTRIKDQYPDAIAVGSTTAGEICFGKLQLNTIVITVTLFDATQVEAFGVSCSAGEEHEAGYELASRIHDYKGPIAGILLLATPQTINIGEVFRVMQEPPMEFPLFGGGAVSYHLSDDSFIFYGDAILMSGCIAVVFLGTELNIQVESHLGWQPLTRELTVTESNGLIVQSIDGQHVYDLYQKYLKIKEEDDFFLNVLEFPLLLERKGKLIARVPFVLRENGAVEFVADVKQGERVRIGYGDPEIILRNAEAIRNKLCNFQPEVIFIYSCICRRFLMQSDVNLELLPFNEVSDTVGFFTGGEFISFDGRPELLNSSSVIIGMREGAKVQHCKSTIETPSGDEFGVLPADPYSSKHTRIVSRLLHFIESLTLELELANNDLKTISELDRLTQIFNRMKLDRVLEAELLKSELYQSAFSVILFDIDQFKAINDRLGHNVGDTILIGIAELLKTKIRNTDIFGRWGGDEFMIILPESDADHACAVAEMLRDAVEQSKFENNLPITCSFGTTVYKSGDNEKSLVARADQSMYQAKEKGRNQVCCFR